jgi:hypothetical protein
MGVAVLLDKPSRSQRKKIQIEDKRVSAFLFNERQRAVPILVCCCVKKGQAECRMSMNFWRAPTKVVAVRISLRTPVWAVLGQAARALDGDDIVVASRWERITRRKSSRRSRHFAGNWRPIVETPSVICVRRRGGFRLSQITDGVYELGNKVVQRHELASDSLLGAELNIPTPHNYL